MHAYATLYVTVYTTYILITQLCKLVSISINQVRREPDVHRVDLAFINLQVDLMEYAKRDMIVTNCNW